MRGLSRPFKYASLRRTHQSQSNRTKTIKIRGMLVEDRVMPETPPVTYMPKDNSEVVERQTCGKWIFRDCNGVWRHHDSPYWRKSGEDLRKIEPLSGQREWAGGGNHPFPIVTESSCLVVLTHQCGSQDTVWVGLFPFHAPSFLAQREWCT